MVASKESAPQFSRHRSTSHWLRMAGVVVALLVVATGVHYLLGRFGGSDDEASTPRVIVLPTPAAVAKPEPMVSPAIPTVLPRSGTGPRPITMPREIRDALNLSASATMREALPIERKTDVVCGEVSADGSGRNFQRFVYIGIARTGKIDDGSPLFRKYVEMVCVQQPER